MILTTTSTVQNKEVSDYIGLVSGDAIIGANVFRDFFAGMRDFFGGRSASYEKVLGDARSEALREIEEAALAIGADAVIGIHFDLQVMGQKNGMLAVSATGTAVKFR